MATSEVSIKGNSVNGKGDNSSGDARNSGGEAQNASSSSSSARGNVVSSACALWRVWRDDNKFFFGFRRGSCALQGAVARVCRSSGDGAQRKRARVLLSSRTHRAGR